MGNLLLFFLLFPSTALAIDCPEGYFPVRAHPRNSYVMSDGTRVSAADVKEQCRPYRSPKKPVLLFSTMPPAKWRSRQKRYRTWTKTEQESIRTIVDGLPQSLTYFGEIKFLREIGPALTPGYSNSFYQVVVITDDIASHDLKRVVAHELAHFYWDSLSQDKRNEYLNSAEWFSADGGKTGSLIRKNVPIPDSYSSPDEDFTNSVELFIHDKSLLEKSSILLKCLENFIQ